MGGWQLEVFRFSLYIFFPVACFYVFHKDSLLDGQFRRVQSRIYSAEDAKRRAELGRVKEAFAEIKEKEKLKILKKELEKVSKSSATDQ